MTPIKVKVGDLVISRVEKYLFLNYYLPMG
jgi:hypothetical protein